MSAYKVATLLEELTKVSKEYFKSTELNPDYLAFLYVQVGPRNIAAVINEMMKIENAYVENMKGSLDRVLLENKAATNEFKQIECRVPLIEEKL